MPGHDDRMLSVSTLVSIALHGVLAVPVIFDLDLFGSRLDEPVIAFAIGMVPLSEVTAAPEIGEVTPPRPLERLEEPAGNEAREVDTVDAEAPEQAPSAEAAPEASSEPPPADNLATETPPQVAAADSPPLLSEAPEAPPEDTAEPAPAPPPSLAEPDLPQAPNAPAPDAPEVAALDTPVLPSVPQPEDRPADPAIPAPPLPPDRVQARVRADPDPAEDDEDDEEPPVDAETPPAPEQLPEQPQVAAIETPPAPALVPQRDRAPDPPNPPSPVVDNTAEPPERQSPIDSVLQSMQDPTTAATSGQGSGSDAGSGGSSGSGTAQSGARLAGATLTLSQEEALRAQLATCWLLPSGAAGIENMTVTIQAIMRPDRTVESAQIIDPQNRRSSDPAFNAFAESARRAVMLCQPLALPQDRYADWNVLNLNFDPRSMF